VTDESLFYRRFVGDVRACAGRRAPAAVREIELRIEAALAAPVPEREGRWARVVSAIAELLAVVDERTPPVVRLRRFLRENADLNRPRDVALTDFRFVVRPDTVLRVGGTQRYLLFAPFPRATAAAARALDEIVPTPARRLAEWCVYGLCSGAAAAALWFAFVAPV
jgi:hypothetical protein